MASIQGNEGQMQGPATQGQME